MAVSFLTPLAGLVALAAVLPLAAYVGRERRAGQVRGLLGLAAPSRRSRAALVVALLAVPGLVGLAAAQPVLDLSRDRHERSDAEAWIVLDTSRSMLGSGGLDRPTRFDRSRRLAAELRAALPEIPIGLASLTDRTLPHLFPTTDAGVFSSALATSIGVERPPPALWFAERATDLDALAAVVERGYLSPGAANRLLVLLSDGEAREYPLRLASVVEATPGLELLLVPVWGGDERIWATGAAEPGYEPDPAGPETLARVAEEAGGRVVPEDRPWELVAAAREALGEGPTHVVARDGRSIPLMPFATAAALVPLGFLLRRRNL